mmetsp:Transcript_52486/g.140504  ORF Transcript_52486/g.140504 Transcript_52486/m.140504 type:complete len:260 (-) Transcript_52486:1488-2267(-)
MAREGQRGSRRGAAQQGGLDDLQLLGGLRPVPDDELAEPTAHGLVVAVAEPGLRAANAEDAAGVDSTGAQGSVADLLGTRVADLVEARLPLRAVVANRVDVRSAQGLLLLAHEVARAEALRLQAAEVLAAMPLHGVLLVVLEFCHCGPIQLRLPLQNGRYGDLALGAAGQRWGIVAPPRRHSREMHRRPAGYGGGHILGTAVRRCLCIIPMATPVGQCIHDYTICDGEVQGGEPEGSAFKGARLDRWRGCRRLGGRRER